MNKPIGIPVLNKDYVQTMISEEMLWENGKCVTFRYSDWTLTLKKEGSQYLPFSYSLSGSKINSLESWSRRYADLENALLHIFNAFNENSNLKNKYETLSKALNDF